MSIEPTIVDRAEQPYVAIRGAITMDTFALIADRFPELFEWLGSRGVAPGGPPFFKYDVIDMERELIVEAGVPVAAGVAGDGDVLAGVLPPGRYVTVTHIGHPDELIDVTAELLAWASDRDLEWDATDVAAGRQWGCRLEVMKTNPAEQPDMNQWETELAFRLAD